MAEKATTTNTAAPSSSSWMSARKILHGLAFTFIFCTTVSELGLSGYQINKYGRSDSHYPGREYKHNVGLILFNSIFTLLFIFGHAFANLLIASVFSFVCAVFWGTSAGIMYQATPFKGTRCGDDVSSFPLNWQPYTNECSKVVAMEALAWMNWVIFVVLFIGFLAQMFEFKRSARVTLYGA